MIVQMIDDTSVESISELLSKVHRLKFWKSFPSSILFYTSMVASDCRNFPRIVLTHQPSQHTDTSDRLPGFRSSFGELNLVCWIECKQDTKTGSVRHGRTLLGPMWAPIGTCTGVTWFCPCLVSSLAFYK